MTDVEVVVAEDAEGAARAAAEQLVTVVRAGGHVALAGGTTPRRAYELAAAMEGRWGRVELWWGDERCVPPSDLRSNYRLARETLLDRLSRPPHAVHRIRGELGAEEAARRYDEELQGVTLDLALLGVGSDGHTASLFPGSPALAEQRLAVAVAVPAPDVPRVTLTPAALNAARAVVFLATGQEKQEAVRLAFAGEPDDEVPASRIRADAGRTHAILDRASAAGLNS